MFKTVGCWSVPISLMFILPLQVSAVSIKEDPFKYSSAYTDSESGLQYLQARYYDPEDEMRFITRDTSKLPNRYAYGNSNPIMNDDPTGHDARETAKIMQGLNWALTVSGLLLSLGDIFVGVAGIAIADSFFETAGESVVATAARSVARRTAVLGAFGVVNAGLGFDVLAHPNMRTRTLRNIQFVQDTVGFLSGLMEFGMGIPEANFEAEEVPATEASLRQRINAYLPVRLQLFKNARLTMGLALGPVSSTFAVIDFINTAKAYGDGNDTKETGLQKAEQGLGWVLLGIGLADNLLTYGSLSNAVYQNRASIGLFGRIMTGGERASFAQWFIRTTGYGLRRGAGASSAAMSALGDEEL